MPKGRLLIIGLVWPEPISTAAGCRMLQLINQFLKQGLDITFASSASKTPQSFPLETLGVTTINIELNSGSFNEFITSLHPNVVLFDRFVTEEQFGWRVAQHCPGALRILDTEDFHGLRKGREEALKANDTFGLDYLQNDTTKREVASIYRCDLSLIISEIEIGIMIQQLNINKDLLFYLPFLEESESVKEFVGSGNKTIKLPSFEARKHFITVGNFLHKPNYDAVLYLKKSIWPLIKKQLQHAELHIYGAYAPQKIWQLHNERDGFFIKGFVDDINKVMQDSKICLAPLRFGAGLKGKLIDAMKNGTPCVMSYIAAEAMFGDLKANGFISDEAEDFAQKAITLYQNQVMWQTMQRHGFAVLSKRFDPLLFQMDFENRIVTLTKNLKTHRQKNFIGQLLQHHTLQSTKYLSKWIETKSKLK